MTQFSLFFLQDKLLAFELHNALLKRGDDPWIGGFDHGIHYLLYFGL
nr:hypothetical protein [uncultured Hyphomonas sp.]